jgi:hypothetical protein
LISSVIYSADDLVIPTNARTSAKRPALERVSPFVVHSGTCSGDVFDVLPLSALRINCSVKDSDYVLVNLLTKPKYSEGSGGEVVVDQHHRRSEDPECANFLDSDFHVLFLGAVSAKKATRRGHVLGGGVKSFARRVAATEVPEGTDTLMALAYSLVVGGKTIETITSPWFEYAPSLAGKKRRF